MARHKMTWKDTVIKCDTSLTCCPDCHETQAEVSFKVGAREMVKFVNDLIIGIEGCKFEERMDGDKGCIVLDMNENQWQAKLTELGL